LRRVPRSSPSIQHRSCPLPTRTKAPAPRKVSSRTPRSRGRDPGSKVGWIGAGRMGFEMAAHLARGGADVLIWNRTRATAEPIEKYGGKVATDISELASRDIVFCMVSTWEDVKSVMTALLAGK